MPTGACMGVLGGHTDWVSDVCLCSTVAPQSVFSCSADQTIREWDIRQARHRRTVEGHAHMVESLCSAPEEGLLISASRDTSCILWDARTLQRVTLVDVKWAVFCVCSRIAQKQLCVGTAVGVIVIYDIRNLVRPLHALDEHREQVNALNDVQNAKGFISAGRDGACRCWNDSGKQMWSTGCGTSVFDCVPFYDFPDVGDVYEEERLAFLAATVPRGLEVVGVGCGVSMYMSLCN